MAEEVELKAENVVTPDMPWNDDHAKSVVLADFHNAERYRSNYHDQRWMTAQNLYVAWRERKFWEGTRIPRAALPVYLVYQQVESLLPRVMREVFSDPYWFDAFPMPGTTPEAARAARDLILAQADDVSVDPAQRVQFRAVLWRAIKSALIYGNGILELGWVRMEVERLRWVQEEVPIFATVPDPMFGIPQKQPVGSKLVTRKKVVPIPINKPSVSFVSIMDFYIDPNCPSPNPRDARFVIRRVYKSIDELLSYKGQPGFKIPGKERLIELSQKKAATQGDMTKGHVDAAKRGVWSPYVDQSTDPAAARVDVLIYWTQDRLVWLVGQEDVVYNAPNPEGFIPYYNVVYSEMLDRFYALAISDVLEGEQRLQEGIIDARLDELALSIHTPTVKKRGAQITPYQLKRRPSQVMELEEPGKDLQLLFPQNITQQAFMEVTASDLRAQKATGLTDLAVLGTPTSGGNSASRTATGINTQAQASGSRISGFVEWLEMNCLEPLLADWHNMNTRHLNPEQVLSVLGPEGQALELNPLAVMNADIRVSMRASARMKARFAMLQTFPQLAGVFLDPRFLDLLAKQQGKTVNVMEIAQLLLDALEYPNRVALFRDLTPQEQQVMNQPPPEEILRMQMQRERIAGAKENMETKVEGDLTRDVLKAIIDKSGEVREQAEE